MNADKIRIVRHLGAVSSNSTGMIKELNIVSIDGGNMVYDLREWSVDHCSCGDGISVDNDEAQRLVAMLSSCFRDEIPTADINVVVTRDDELISFLNQKNISFTDKRDKGGALWIVGGHELDNLMISCAELGYKFSFSEKGGKITKSQPGWYLPASNK